MFQNVDLVIFGQEQPVHVSRLLEAGVRIIFYLTDMKVSILSSNKKENVLKCQSILFKTKTLVRIVFSEVKIHGKQPDDFDSLIIDYSAWSQWPKAASVKQCCCQLQDDSCKIGHKVLFLKNIFVRE